MHWTHQTLEFMILNSSILESVVKDKELTNKRLYRHASWNGGLEMGSEKLRIITGSKEPMIINFCEIETLETPVLLCALNF